MTTTTPKDTLVRRIKALLSKTIENGATEAEAMAALAKAQEIMQAHGLDQAAVEAEAFVKDTFKAKRQSRSYYWGLEIAYGVGVFTGTCAYTPNEDRESVVFAGRESDVAFATWLIDALDAFITRAAMAYVNDVDRSTTRRSWGATQPGLFGSGELVVQKRETVNERAKRIKDFGLGVALRISQRLVELATAETKERARQAKAELERDGMRFREGRGSRPNVGDKAAFNAGIAAGDKAAFNRPVNGGRGVLAIA
jgi:hypothetical protein